MPTSREIKALHLNKFSFAFAKAIFAKRSDWFRFASAIEEVDPQGLSTFHLCLTFPCEHPLGGSELKIYPHADQIVSQNWQPPGFSRPLDWDLIGMMAGSPKQWNYTYADLADQMIEFVDALLNEDIVFVETREPHSASGSMGVQYLPGKEPVCDDSKQRVALIHSVTLLDESSSKNVPSEQTLIRSWRGTFDLDINLE